MLIRPHSLSHWIDYFYGYGSWSAPVWFVAHEESGGDLPEEVAEKLDYFMKEHSGVSNPILCDIREVYKNVAVRWEGPKAFLYEKRYDYRFGENAVVSKVWENLIRFLAGYHDHALPDILDYQRNSFAAPSSEEALIKLFPLPGANHHGWNYNWLDLPGDFGFLKSRTQYQQHVYQHRIQNLLGAVLAHKPRLVLMYGMTNINSLKQSVSEHFEGVQFNLVKAVKQKIPQHHYARVRETDFLITTQIPALRHNRVETGFDWLSFGDAVRGLNK